MKRSDWTTSMKVVWHIRHHFESVRNVEPIMVTIGSMSYDGALYEYKGNECLYLLGALPASYIRNRKIFYRFPHDPRDWHLPTHAGVTHYSSYHPFGQMFTLIHESTPGDPRSFKRMFIAIEKPTAIECAQWWVSSHLNKDLAEGSKAHSPDHRFAAILRARSTLKQIDQELAKSPDSQEYAAKELQEVVDKWKLSARPKKRKR